MTPFDGQAVGTSAINAVSGAPAPNTTIVDLNLADRIRGVTYLPIPKRVAHHVLHLGSNHDSTLSSVTNALTSDASMSALLLSLANQPPFSMDRSATKLSAITDQFGFEIINSLSITYALVGRFNQTAVPAELHTAAWTASLFKAVMAEQFIMLTNPILREEAYLCGLLQNIMVPWMIAQLPDGASDVAAVALAFRDSASQRCVFGSDHAQLGGRYTQRLGLPDVYRDVITHQNDRDILADRVGDRMLIEAVLLATEVPVLLDHHRQDQLTELRMRVEGTLTACGIDPDEYWNHVRMQFDSIQEPMQRDAQDGNTEDLLDTAAVTLASGVGILVRNMSSVLTQSKDIAAKVTGLRSQCDQLETKATRDQLTTILNRAGFTELAEKRIKDAGFLNVPIALAYYDCNKFKQINDNYGHDYGDQALMIAANAMSKAARKFDVVGRLGGDEFVMLLFDRARDETMAVVRDVLADVASQTISASNATISFSLSAGVTYVPPPTGSCTLDELLKQSDALMYNAKRSDGEKIRIEDVVAADDSEAESVASTC